MNDEYLEYLMSETFKVGINSISIPHIWITNDSELHASTISF